jgi:hypothetical protein
MVSDERVVDQWLSGPFAPWAGQGGEVDRGSKGAKGEVGLAKGLLFTRPTLALSAATISKMPVKPPRSSLRGDRSSLSGLHSPLLDTLGRPCNP